MVNDPVTPLASATRLDNSVIYLHVCVYDIGMDKNSDVLAGNADTEHRAYTVRLNDRFGYSMNDHFGYGSGCGSYL